MECETLGVVGPETPHLVAFTAVYSPEYYTDCSAWPVLTTATNRDGTKQ